MKFKYIYGPVPSWRLGSSLGVDLVSRRGKICTFDCVYCQIGKTRGLTDKRAVFVPTEKILAEIGSLPVSLKIDYITFSGTGEPTLALNLGEVIRGIRKIRKDRIAVITNSSLIGRKAVAADLALADLVIAKLDASGNGTFKKIDRPLEKIDFNRVVDDIKEFRRGYRGKLALQIMFVEDNMAEAGKIARLAASIRPDEIQLNTPLRPCGVKPLGRKEMRKIAGYFRGMKVRSVYDTERKKVAPLSRKATTMRRGAER
jgi:wyosine [tRNA(Phe)-imidazoG37] synthetase (radical SAM superfamily)